MGKHKTTNYIKIVDFEHTNDRDETELTPDANMDMILDSNLIFEPIPHLSHIHKHKHKHKTTHNKSKHINKPECQYRSHFVYGQKDFYDYSPFIPPQPSIYFSDLNWLPYAQPIKIRK